MEELKGVEAAVAVKQEEVRQLELGIIHREGLLVEAEAAVQLRGEESMKEVERLRMMEDGMVEREKEITLASEGLRLREQVRTTPHLHAQRHSTAQAATQRAETSPLSLSLNTTRHSPPPMLATVIARVRGGDGGEGAQPRGERVGVEGVREGEGRER